MKLSITSFVGLALVANTIGVPIQIPPNTTFHVDTTRHEGVDILERLHLPFVEATTLAAATTIQHEYGRDDPVPFWDLPRCYQDCIESNCCNASPTLGDVRKLTVHEWCSLKWIPVQNWIYDHLQYCVKDSCRNEKAQSRQDSIKWQNKVCGGG
ncbi:hypothetical protein GGS26DRAFT_575615 [Hypomontagnella submonticulosa]|nr:hypothetical protein GGS26DRAFT_575615 [Hypomontagnella submonticulosa]